MPNDKPLSFMVFPHLSLEIREFLYKVVLTYIYTYIWVLANTLAHSASELNKALSVTYKLLFILSKNIVPSRSYRYIRDRAFPVTRLPPPIYTKFDVMQRYIYISALESAPSRPPNPTLTPQNQASSKNPRSKVPKTQKTGCAYSAHYTK